MFSIDLHVHTRLGSADSSVRPGDLVERARARGLVGLGVSEHYRRWSDHEVDQWSAPDVRVYPGAEVATDVGHVLVFGMRDHPADRSIKGLAAEARSQGAALILAHPFRGLFDSPHHWLGNEHRELDRPGVISAAAQRVERYVDAVEVLNSGCTDRENQLARHLAIQSSLPEVAGSDAHTAVEIGRQSTDFGDPPLDADDLAARLLAGDYRVR